MMEEKYIGNYRVLEKIGSGGFAEVYLAVHRDVPNLKVILKILKDARMIERFKQEADKLALLDGHPNICRIKHFFTHGDDTVIAMEYIDGMAFDQKIKDEGRLKVDEALKVMIDVLGILEFAHEKDIYHRDIKPSNIMVDSGGRVKIIDFGIAKGKSDQTLTMVGTSCGTPAYMAPEQFTPTEDTDYSLIDVYAAGTTLFYMLTGQLPFQGDNEFALRDAKLFKEPVSPRSLNAGITRDLENVILKSLKKEPEKRYQSVAEMRQALRDICKFDSSAKESTREQPTAGKPPSGKKSPTLMISVVTVVIIVAAYAVYKLVLSPGEPTPPPPAHLFTPANGEILTESSRPRLSWEAVAGEGGTYILEYATDSTFSDSRTIAGMETGNYAFTSALDNGVYYWRIYATDADGLRGQPSSWSSFTLDALPAMVPTGRLTIYVNPSGNIYIEDELKARNEDRYSVEMDTGTYAVRVENRSSSEKVRHDTLRVTAAGNVSRTYRFTIPVDPEPEQVPAGLGEVRVGSRPRGASIFIDGELQRQKTNYTFRLDPGRHIIRAELALGDDIVAKADTLVVVADSTHKVIFDFE